MNTTTSLKQISLATSAVFAATMTFGIHRVSAGTIISDRTQLNTILACIIHEDFGKYSKALARSSSSDLAEKQSVF